MFLNMVRKLGIFVSGGSKTTTHFRYNASTKIYQSDGNIGTDCLSTFSSDLRIFNITPVADRGLNPSMSGQLYTP